MTSGRGACGDDASATNPDAAAGDPVVNRAISMTDWIYEAESVQIKATLVSTRPQEAIEVRRVEYLKEHPGLPEEKLAKVPFLQPESTSQFAWAWDRRRAAFHGDHPDWLQEDFIWDGEKGIDHLEWRVLGDNSYGVRRRPFPNITDNYFGWLQWAWLGNAAPLQTEGVATAGGRESQEKSRAEFRTLVLHSEVIFDGVPCGMYWEPKLGSWTRVYIERASGRLRGKQVGSWGIEYRRLWLPILAERLQEMGFEATVSNAASIEKSLSHELQKEVLESIRPKLDEAFRAHLEQLDPIWMATFSDWREVKPGCFFPFRQVTHETRQTADKTLADAETRTITIDSLTLGETLPDSLFQVAIAEGARVYDESLGFPVSYTQDKNRTKEEWNELLDRARASHQQTVEEKQSLDDLIGSQAVEFPSTAWLNSDPMTWEKLKGQYVIVDFWHVGCGPCRDAVAWMQALHRNQEERLTVIGVHGSGVTADDLKAAAKGGFKTDPAFPICIDTAVDEKEAREGVYPSVLFQTYQIRRMPYTWLVGPDGKLIAHGDIEEVVNEARRRIRMK